MTGVVDLRQYRLIPGQRDTLIDLFDRYFVDGQIAAGIHVIGQFRDLDDPNRFVWLRGFESMAARGETLPRFYYGPVWQAHRERANATMVDSDDALLLEPLHLAAAFPSSDCTQQPVPATSVVAITVAYLDGALMDADRNLACCVRHELRAAGAEVVAVFISHAAVNNFPVQPLRDENALVWISRFPDDAAYARHRDAQAQSPSWRGLVQRLVERSSLLPIQQLRLRPTDRSQLR